MTKTKVGFLVFIITWISCLCLFDYYRADLCSQSIETDDLPDPIEQVNLNV